jgi:hypothetical protein
MSVHEPIAPYEKSAWWSALMPARTTTTGGVHLSPGMAIGRRLESDHRSLISVEWLHGIHPPPDPMAGGHLSFSLLGEQLDVTSTFTDRGGKGGTMKHTNNADKAFKFLRPTTHERVNQLRGKTVWALRPVEATSASREYDPCYVVARVAVDQSQLKPDEIRIAYDGVGGVCTSDIASMVGSVHGVSLPMFVTAGRSVTMHGEGDYHEITLTTEMERLRALVREGHHAHVDAQARLKQMGDELSEVSLAYTRHSIVHDALQVKHNALQAKYDTFTSEHVDVKKQVNILTDEKKQLVDQLTQCDASLTTMTADRDAIQLERDTLQMANGQHALEVSTQLSTFTAYFTTRRPSTAARAGPLDRA